MKIQKIEVQNFKAVSKKELNLNGCSAIVTAANDSGKTSILRGLIDRFKSEKPEVIVKEGKEKGYNHIELTDGSRIEWDFTQKSERFSYITKDGVKQTTGVLSQIGEKYFGQKFDIDSFLKSSPKQQEKELQKIVGLDFDKIDQRYKEAYEERTEANRYLKQVSSQKLSEPEKVEKPDIESIKEELKKAREHNESVRNQNREAKKYESLQKQVSSLIDETEFEDLFDYGKSKEIIKDKKSNDDLIDISELESKLEDANDQLRKYDAYKRELEAYNKWVDQGKIARSDAESTDKKVKEIEAEKQEMIANADMPDGFGIDESGLTYKDFPLSETQISTSAKYIAALKLGAMVLGKVRALHFDASSLDNNNLKKVQDWAKENDLQLLIERPDFDGGEIKYEIIEK
jgi:hypothetical protein